MKIFVWSLLAVISLAFEISAIKEGIKLKKQGEKLNVYTYSGTALQNIVTFAVVTLLCLYVLIHFIVFS